MNSFSSSQNSGDAAPRLPRKELHKLCRTAGTTKIFGDLLDYSEDSFATLDKIIEYKWPEPPARLDEMTTFFGAYVGETIRRRLNWRWIQSDGGDWHLVFGTGIDFLAFPFAKVRKRLLNGQVDSLEDYFSTLKLLSHGTR